MKPGVLLLAVLVLLGPGSVGAIEVITSFHTDIRVLPTASLEITETIRVEAESEEIRRGIYRDFPTRYEDVLGTYHNVGFDIIAVKRDGIEEPFTVDDHANGKRIYIGRPDHLLEPGEYTYQLTYHTDRQLHFGTDRDELYWNVTGNGWIFPILEASATVQLPEAVPASQIETTGYVGEQGETGRAFDEQVGAGGRVHFRTLRRLDANEGLTIVASWPKGHVAEPDFATRLNWFMADNQATIRAGGGLLGLLVFYLLLWFFAGRDPRSGTIITRYQPPPKVSPAGMRYIMQMGYDSRCFAAAIISMAIKGVLRVYRPNSFDYALAVQDSSREPLLSAGEVAVARALFDDDYARSSLEVSQSNHEFFGRAQKALRKTLRQEYQAANFRKNWLAVTSGLLGSAALLLFIATEVFPNPFGVTIAVAAAAVSLAVVFNRLDGGISVPFALGLMLALGLAMFKFRDLIPGTLLAGSVMLANVGFAHLLKAPTRMGRGLMDQIEGFRDYLSVAEEDELKQSALPDEIPPRKTPDLFETYFPYALALGVEQRWAEKFSEVLEVAATVPDGYRTPLGRSSEFRPQHMSDLGSALSSSIASASTSPGSSGGGSGSSGGSSGGGGGGGGGGGW
jgi:uncharacterized membrane protein YgcG